MESPEFFSPGAATHGTQTNEKDHNEAQGSMKERSGSQRTRNEHKRIENDHRGPQSITKDHKGSQRTTKDHKGAGAQVSRGTYNRRIAVGLFATVGNYLEVLNMTLQQYQ